MSHKTGAQQCWRTGEEMGSHSTCGSRRFCYFKKYRRTQSLYLFRVSLGREAPVCEVD